MQHALAHILPDLVAEIAAALSSQGRGDLARQLEVGIIERCTYDPSADGGLDLGYIYLARSSPKSHSEKRSAPVAETIPFYHMDEAKGVVGVNVDVDHDGHLFGIELLSRTDVIARLRDANAL
jgi:hypothetical protein